MKVIFTLSFLCLLWACTNNNADGKNAQSTVVNDTTFLRKAPVNPYATLDISPMDICYLPLDYPILKMSGKATGPPAARVIYSRPYRQGRQIFGSLLKYGEPWRLGANEATEIEVFQPITIQNKSISKGRYILYCIPQPNTWTIVFNTNTFTWGLRPDRSKDAYTFDIPVQKTPTTIEYFTMAFEQTGADANLLMAWEDAEARLPIEVK